MSNTNTPTKGSLFPPFSPPSSSSGSGGSRKSSFVAMIAATVDSISLSRFLSLSFDDDVNQSKSRSPLAPSPSSAGTFQSPLRGGFTGPLTRIRCELAIGGEKKLFDASLVTGEDDDVSPISPQDKGVLPSSIPRPTASKKPVRMSPSTTTPSSWKKGRDSPSMSELIFKPTNEEESITICRIDSEQVHSVHGLSLEVSVFLVQDDDVFLLATAMETHTMDELPTLQPPVRNPRTLSLSNRSGERVGEVHCQLSFQPVKSLQVSSPGPSSIPSSSLNQTDQEISTEGQRAPSPLTVLMAASTTLNKGEDVAASSQSTIANSMLHYPPTPQRREPTLANRMQGYSLVHPSSSSPSCSPSRGGGSALSTPTRGSPSAVRGKTTTIDTQRSPAERRAAARAIKQQQQKEKEKRRKPFAASSNVIGSLGLPLPAFGSSAAQAKIENVTHTLSGGVVGGSMPRDKNKANKDQVGRERELDPAIEVVHSGGGNMGSGRRRYPSGRNSDGPSFFVQLSDFLDSLSPGAIALLGAQLIVTLCLALYAYVQLQVPDSSSPITAITSATVIGIEAATAPSIVDTVTSMPVSVTVPIIESVEPLSTISPNAVGAAVEVVLTSSSSGGSSKVTIGGRSATSGGMISQPIIESPPSSCVIQGGSSQLSLTGNIFTAEQLMNSLPINDSIFVQLIFNDGANGSDLEEIEDKCLQWKVGTLKGAMVWDSCRNLESWWQFTVFQGTKDEGPGYFTITGLQSKKCLILKKNSKKVNFTDPGSVISSLQLARCDETNKSILWSSSPIGDTDGITSGSENIAFPVLFKSKVLTSVK